MGMHPITRCLLLFAVTCSKSIVADEILPHVSTGESDVASTVTELAFNDYRVCITDYPTTHIDQATVEVFKGKERVFQKSQRHFSIGYDEYRDRGDLRDLIRTGTDITGNGLPNLVVSEFSGGAHCCHAFLVFELGEEFKHLATIEVLDNGSAHFEDRDGDANLEFVMADYTFAYWNECFAESPAPRVVLRFKDDGYHIAEDLMRAPAPSDSEIGERVAEIAAHPRWTEGRPPTKLWDIMLKWIYSGNDDAAWALLGQAWPPDLPGKEEFRGAFKEQLAKSRWWPEVKAMCDRTKDEKRP